MKKRKQRRLVSWLLVMMITLNVFSPLNHVWAEGLDTLDGGLDSVIEISNSDHVASGSQANKPEASGEEETDVPGDTGGLEKGQTDEPTTATDSNASGVSLLAAPGPMDAVPLAGAKDVTKLLTDLIISITQNDSPVTEITAGQNFTVEGSFHVPVQGDGISDPDQYVRYGDYAILQLDEGITVVGSTELDLMFEGEKVGTLTFENNPLQVRIDFSGEVLNEPGTSNVNCEFGVSMKYTGTDVTEEEPKDNVWILGKQFTIKAAEIPITQTQSKSGKLSDDKTQIEWTVKVNAKKSSDISLLGYLFQDDLTNAGEYVENSFKVNDHEPDPKVTPDAGHVLSYVFGDVKGEQVITFSTEIPANTLITGGTIKNTAKFGKDKLIDTNTPEISIPPKTLIKKSGIAGDGLSGDIYNPNNRTITWTIIANQDQIPLKDLTITDTLPTNPAGLSWKSAKWEYESAADTWAELTTGDGLTDVPSYEYQPAGGAYKLTGTTSKKVRLTIVSNVSDDAYVGSVRTYRNTAYLTWNGKPAGTFSSFADVSIGIDGLTKGYVSTDYVNRQITWRTTVDLKKQTGFTSTSDIKVYDLLIYGKSGTVNIGTSNLPDLLPTGSDLTKLTPKYGQKIVDNSWPAGLNYEIKPVIAGGTRVGDLLIVSGFGTDKAYPFTFKTQVLDPTIFAANTGKSIDNTASLYYGAVYLDNGSASTTYNSNVLSKQVYQAGTNTVGNSENAFNPKDKTAVFRLNINWEGRDLTGAAIANGTLGKVTVTDTLPDGWSFVDIDSNVTYQLYTSTNTLVTDSSDILESAVISGRNAEFVFKKLEKAYYILVKAKLSDDKHMDYLKTSYSNGKNDSYQTAANSVKLTAENDSSWKPQKEASIQVPTQFLVKNINTGKNPIEWTIKFNPYDLPGFTNIKITDKIPVGLELLFLRNGSLDFTAFTVTEYDQMVNGAFPTSGGTVLTTGQLQDRLSYDKDSRELSMTLTDGKLYQIVYITEVTGNVGSTLKNQVKVSGSSINGTGTNASYQVDSSHASATLERNGYLDIRKVNAQNQIIDGAVFTLYTDKALQDPVRTTIVQPDGTLRIIPIPAPKTFGDPGFTYYLKETTIPDTYESDDMVYVVTVEKNSSNKAVTTVAGKSAGTVLTVVNYKPDTVGSLSISKTVDGNGGDTGKEFNFTIHLTGPNADRTYNYIGSGSKENGLLTVTGGLGTIQLKHNESIMITGLPKDTFYVVTEDDYSADEYLTGSTGSSGIIKTNEVKAAAFTNTKFLPGSLAIKKTVKGNGGDREKLFEFTVSFTKPGGGPDNRSYSFTGTGGALDGTIESGGKISLSDGQGIIITGLPKDTSYAVSEENYSGDGYHTDSTGTSGTIKTDEVHIAEFTNTRFLPGSLTIKKTVAGNSGETGPFEFTVSFEKPDGTPDHNLYSFTGTGGDKNGTIQSGGNISLSRGQSITITGLPKDTSYTVTEKDYSANGYSTVSTGSSGIITSGEEQTASFTNTKIMPGSLTISKTVTGSGADIKKKFDFTVTFHSNGTYPYTGNGVADGTIKSGDKISLADGESITITGLPDGTEYQVTESSYSPERYTADQTGETGTIRTLETSTAAFTNTYRRPASGGGGGGGPKVTTIPAEPAVPTTAPAAPVPAEPTITIADSTPTGNMEGRTSDELININGGVPAGTRYGRNGLPKTGDNRSGNMVIYGLLCILSVLGMAASANILRRKHSDK